MIRRLTLFRVLALLALFLMVPASMVSAQDAGNDDSFVLQINRPVTVAPDESYEALMVVDDNLTMDGTVTDALIVINGDAVVNGEVAGDIVMVNGTLTLGAGATVENVNLFRSELVRDAAATITGDLNEESSFSPVIFGLSVLSVMFWIGIVIVTMLAGLAFVALAGRFMARATESILQRPLETGVTGLATWVILPILAVVAFVTLIGIPVGLVIVLVVIPLLALVGYLVSAYLVGTWLAAVTKVEAGRYLAVIAGVIVLQLLGLVPWIGGLVVFISTMFGTGAVVYRLWMDRRERRQASTTVAPMGGPAHA
jgi:hypothetical protein